MLNQRIEALRDAGGGLLYLKPGNYFTNKTIKLYKNIVLLGSGRGSTRLIKGPQWVPNATLLDMSGVLSTDPTAGDGNKSHMFVMDLDLWSGPNWNVGTGLILDTSYTSISKIERVNIAGCPGTAWLMRQMWDSAITDVHIKNSGGSNGDSDAAVRIVGSENDCSNNLFVNNMTIEACPHMGLYIGGYEENPDANTARQRAYNINFTDLKVENVRIVDNATLVRTTKNTNQVRFVRPFIFADNRARTAVAPNVCLLDYDGEDHKISDFRGGHGTGSSSGGGVQLRSAIRLGRRRLGSKIDGVSVAGAAIGCVIEVDRYQIDGTTPVNYRQGSCVVNNIVRDNETIPLLGGTGAGYTNVRLPQLFRSRSKLTASSGRTIRRGETNQIIEYTGTATAAAKMVIDVESANLETGIEGDFIEVHQAGTGPVSLEGFTGVTLQIPNSLSATTSEQYQVLRADRLDRNLWRLTRGAPRPAGVLIAEQTSTQGSKPFTWRVRDNVQIVAGDFWNVQRATSIANLNAGTLNGDAIQQITPQDLAGGDVTITGLSATPSGPLALRVRTGREDGQGGYVWNEWSNILTDTIT